MIKKTYQASNGFHDLMPGKNELILTAWFDDDGKMIAGPTGKEAISFNEIQISGDSDFRRSLLPDGADQDAILFLDDPNYKDKYIRLQTLAGKQIPEEHSKDFVARWVCLSLLDQETIERGEEPEYCCFTTERGHWGGIKELSLKREMVDYIDNMDSETRDSLANATSSRDFARTFVNWRDGIDTLRIQYKPLVESGGD